MKHATNLVLVVLLITLLSPSRAEGPIFQATIGGLRTPDGKAIRLDYPIERHLRNAVGRDGAGLCVFTSLTHAADWQNVEALQQFRDWMRQHPGGGWPEKVDAMITRLCRERGLPVPQYLQYQGNDISILKLACKTGRMPCVTYCFSPAGRYQGRRIAHMVNLLHADERWFAVLDNNFPGTVEWMNEEEFRRTFTGLGEGWAIILLAPSPPPRCP
ncbi:MAG: hypothetical protein RMI91_01835 [Gemmatales bacterium]|nr:hypothetical protein [Gemmatales bacterium]MDW7993367.1 hypothetical protein [Gemmatales bacterium]